MLAVISHLVIDAVGEWRIAAVMSCRTLHVVLKELTFRIHLPRMKKPATRGDSR
jgi:hypothetical protein